MLHCPSWAYAEHQILLPIVMLLQCTCSWTLARVRCCCCCNQSDPWTILYSLLEGQSTAGNDRMPSQLPHSCCCSTHYLCSHLDTSPALSLLMPHATPRAAVIIWAMFPYGGIEATCDVAFRWLFDARPRTDINARYEQISRA